MNKRNRFLLSLLVVGIAAWFISPTVNWYFFTSEDDKTLAASTRDQMKTYAEGLSQRKLGELTEAAKADPDAEIGSEYAFLVKAAKANYKLEKRKTPKTWTISDVMKGFRGENELVLLLEDHYRKEVMALKDLKGRILKLGLDLSGGMSVVIKADMESLAQRLDRTPTVEDKEDAIARALEILNNRIDKFGLTEPQIRREAGGERIFIEIPGDPDPEVANSFLKGKGTLAFHIVDSELTSKVKTYIQTNPADAFGLDGELTLPEGFLPEGSEVRKLYEKDEYGLDVFIDRMVILTDEKNVVDGSHITAAQVAYDQVTGKPTVNFQLDGEGADLFFNLTDNNVGKTLAIVMDDKIKAGARISEAIPGGSVRVTGFDANEAGDLALVLRTAALPVDLIVENSQSVGASLGEDSISEGLKAIALGFALVILFMLIYYKGSGLVANLALILNLFFIVSILSAFSMTLTLTSIAGIILTVGMAVDANVIIFERIKEEYRLGKSAGASIEAGFKKAFWTIMDANITTFIAAIFLSYLGKGPIQGFAVTLAVGIISSMFTALYISRLVFDFGVDVLKLQKLSITWRKN